MILIPNILKLDQRNLSILKLLAIGKSQSDIAKALKINAGSLSKTVKRMIEKGLIEEKEYSMKKDYVLTELGSKAILSGKTKEIENRINNKVHIKQRKKGKAQKNYEKKARNKGSKSKKEKVNSHTQQEKVNSYDQYIYRLHAKRTTYPLANLPLTKKEMRGLYEGYVKRFPAVLNKINNNTQVFVNATSELDKWIPDQEKGHIFRYVDLSFRITTRSLILYGPNIEVRFEDIQEVRELYERYSQVMQPLLMMLEEDIQERIPRFRVQRTHGGIILGKPWKTGEVALTADKIAMKAPKGKKHIIYNKAGEELGNIDLSVKTHPELEMTHDLLSEDYMANYDELVRATAEGDFDYEKDHAIVHSAIKLITTAVEKLMEQDTAIRDLKGTISEFAAIVLSDRKEMKVKSEYIDRKIQDLVDAHQITSQEMLALIRVVRDTN